MYVSVCCIVLQRNTKYGRKSSTRQQEYSCTKTSNVTNNAEKWGRVDFMSTFLTPDTFAYMILSWQLWLLKNLPFIMARMHHDNQRKQNSTIYFCIRLRFEWSDGLFTTIEWQWILGEWSLRIKKRSHSTSKIFSEPQSIYTMELRKVTCVHKQREIHVTKPGFTMETYKQLTTASCNEKSDVRSLLSITSGRNMTTQTKNNSRDSKTLVLFSGNFLTRLQKYLHTVLFMDSVPVFLLLLFNNRISTAV